VVRSDAYLNPFRPERKDGEQFKEKSPENTLQEYKTMPVNTVYALAKLPIFQEQSLIFKRFPCCFWKPFEVRSSKEYMPARSVLTTSAHVTCAVCLPSPPYFFFFFFICFFILFFSACLFILFLFTLFCFCRGFYHVPCLLQC
jgi:hypothetical protein